jgi:hypothetical protein
LHEAGFLVRGASRAFSEEVAAFAVPDNFLQKPPNIDYFTQIAT